MASILDDLFGSAEELGGSQDFLVGGDIQTGPVQPIWFTKHKCPIVNRELYLREPEPGKQRIVKYTGKAVGFAFEVKKMPKDLLAIFKQLESEGKAKLIMVEHQDSKKPKKDYYQLTNPVERFFFLTRGLPNKNIISRFPDKQVGIAAGKITDYEPGELPMQTTYTFVSVLAVSKTLYEAGYVDDDGLPIPIVIRAKGIFGDELYQALTPHYNFLKAGIEAGLDRRKAQFWAYGVDLKISENEVEHGKAPNSTFVHTFMNNTFDPEGENYTDKPVFNEKIAEDLYCGDDMLLPLMSLLYDMTVRPPRPGGMAEEWCKRKVKEALENQHEWNPKGDLPLGRKPAPAWMITKKSREEAASTFSKEALYGRDEDEQPVRSGKPQKASDPYQEVREKFIPALNVIKKDFARLRDKDGLEMIKKAVAYLDNAGGELEPFEIEVEVEDLIEAAKKHRAKLQSGDEYEI